MNEQYVPQVVHKSSISASLNSTRTLTTTNELTTSTISDENYEMMLSVNASITLLVGIIQLAMCVFRLGFLTALFSNAMVSGYTTGLAVIVFSTQVPSFFGYSAQTYSGPFSLYHVRVHMHC